MTDRPARRKSALGALLALVVGLAACGSPGPSPSRTSDELPSALSSPSVTPPDSSASAGAELPNPGKPFDAADVLEAMRNSPRPDGVPDELETEAVAGAVADAIWTLDGRPWSAIVAGGSCGPSACTLELSGSAADAVGEDAWVFDVDPATGSVEVMTAELHGLPQPLVSLLDEVARRALREVTDDAELLLTAARWLPPPAAEHHYRLSYRSGDEEGSCAVELELDAAAREVTSVEAEDC